MVDLGQLHVYLADQATPDYYISVDVDCTAIDLITEIIQLQCIIKNSIVNKIQINLCSGLHDSFAKVLSTEESQERIKHVIKALCHSLMVLQLALGHQRRVHTVIQYRVQCMTVDNRFDDKR